MLGSAFIALLSWPHLHALRKDLGSERLGSQPSDVHVYALYHH